MGAMEGAAAGVMYNYQCNLGCRQALRAQISEQEAHFGPAVMGSCPAACLSLSDSQSCCRRAQLFAQAPPEFAAQGIKVS